MFPATEVANLYPPKAVTKAPASGDKKPEKIPTVMYPALTNTSLDKD